MQRLAILTFLTLSAAGWMALQQQRLAAFQTEPAAQQPVATDSTAPPAGQPAADPNAPDNPQASPTPPVEPPPDPAIVAKAEQLLREARDRLYACKSVRANFTEHASIGGRKFTAKGTYLAGLPFPPALRLEYRIRVGDSEGVLIEVSDGNVLRTSKEIRPVDPNSKDPVISQWTRKDISQILKAADSPDLPDEAILQAELSLGGIPTLLASLERSVTFDTYREQTWQGQPAILIEGRWRQDFMQRVAQGFGGQLQSVANLLPDRVRIYFDPQTLFPTRILYRKRISLSPPAYVPLMSIEFSDIRLNEPVDAQEFRYIPPKGVDEVDETPLYLNMIQKMKAAQQQAPAAASPPTDAVPPDSVQPSPAAPPDSAAAPIP